MGMAYKSPPGYRRKFIIGGDVVDKLRGLVKDFAHWPGGDLGNHLDAAVDAARASPANVEQWFEDSFSHGIQDNTIIRCDAELGIESILYAVTTVIAEGSEAGRQIVVTVLNKEDRDRSIAERRWLKERPARSKYRHPGEPKVEEPIRQHGPLRVPMAELLKEPVEPIMEQPVNVVRSDLDGEFAVSWTADGEHFAFEITRDIKKKVEELINAGVRPAAMRFWKALPAQVKVVVEF
jgi:hypothetical protein